MDFEIRHESARLLKPVVNAAARTLKHAQIELGPGGMRIWGNDQTNVAGIDVEIPADAFDTYDVEAGTFQTNIDAWGDAFRGTRKTDPVAVYTEPNDYDSLRDVAAIGTNTKRVLRDLGFDSIEALESADPEDLVGETDYESHGDTKTAEIDMEKAEEIVFEVNGSHVVIESDGERQIDGDASDHPRVRYPTLSFSVPGREVEATATVNGKDFSKAYRAVASVTDAAFLGATEGAFLLYGEGDTDRVHAAPDAEVNGGGAGGLYNAEWLSTLRLSLDRKASTDLTFHLPVVDDGGERGGKHILWADYAIRDADVEWFMAPKIMGAAADDDADPETEAERLERIAPSNYSPTENVRWDVETTGGDAKAWFSVMDAKTDEAKVHLEPDGLTARFVEPANVMMQDVQIGEDAFESYTWRQPAGRLYDQDRVIGLAQTWVTDYLKLFTKTEEVRFQVDEKAQFAIIGENFTATMPTIDPDSVRQEPDLPGLDLPGSVTVDFESFADAVDTADDVADHVGLVMYDGECYVHADGDLDDAWVPVETEAGEGYASSLFSAEYLTDYLDSVPSGATETVTFFGGREFPLFAEHEVAHPDADFTLMLAPRIQDDSGGVYGSDAIKEHGMDPLRIKDADPIYTVNDEGHVVADNPGESLASTPEEAAEQVRDDEDDDGDVYDPTTEFSDDYGPTMDTPIPASEREMMAGVQGTGIAPSDLTRREHVTLDDTTVHRDDVEDPEQRQEFTDAVAGIYDPSQDLEGDADEFRAAWNHSAGVPEEIGDWTLKTQVDEGRPVYQKDGRELRVNRSFDTDVVHRRYYVELREAEPNDTGVRDREHLASDLSPEEAMNALEEAALERSDGGDTYQPDEEEGDLVEVRSPFRPLTRSAKKALWDEYDAVEELEATDDAGRGEGVLLPERPPQDFLDQHELEVVRDPLVTYDSSSGVVEVYTDPDKVTVGSTETSMDPAEAVEQAEQQPENFTLKSGDPTDVPGYDGTDDEGGVYDPTDEFEEMEEPSEISGIGEGRRKTLDALDEKATLDDPQSFDSLEEMVNAVREISLAHRDGRTYMAPPEKAINAIESTYEQLPEEARDEFLNDHRLYVKIRAARNRFNDWMGKKRREQEIPSTMEAGPSNYPSKKAKKTAQYARDGKEELDEAIDKIRSAANGAKQRALQAIGTSVGEQNEQQRQEKREERRETFEKGDLAFWSDTVYGNALWGVKRVNKKSVRLRRPHNSAGMEVPMSDGDTYPEYDETRADLDSDRLEGPVPAEEVAKFDADDAGVRAPEDYIPARVDTAKEAKMAVFGEEWARKNLDLSDDGTPAEDQPWLDELKGIGSATYDDLVALGLSNIGDAKEAYRNRANSDTWQKALNAMPAKQGRVSLMEAVGADPEATVAEDMEQAEETATEDLADELRDRGVNNVVAHNLADQYDTLEAVQSAAAGADDVTDLQGVGDASALQVRRALDLEPEQDDAADDADDNDTPTPDPTPTTGDRGKAEEHRKAVEAAREADPDGDLPGPALSALKKNWSVYKRGIKEGREAVEEATEYRDEHRGDAEEAAAIINDIRDAYGQEPIDFDGVDGVPEVAELGGPITAESSGVSLSFDWKADPYDPTEEV
ncbi:head protein [Haloarcula californiae icosahedral virus 1]|uniref:Uncharacterized protein n=1 Tax=Haloarcula californiae icosahedral virus 1 TaxID=1735722 RepID=A0A1C7A3Q1_9VIRU|nr:head protein [Haloarcula californiae icosahedral virus 1]ALJ99672.1 hypothetical protein SS136_09 [Haloarcula californiae icosahedral virus 1]